MAGLGVTLLPQLLITLIVGDCRQSTMMVLVECPRGRSLVFPPSVRVTATSQDIGDVSVSGHP